MAVKRSMRAVTEDGDHLEQLRNLALVIADEIDAGDGSHSMAQLARQYRETLDEIAALEDMGGGDELDGVLG